LETNEEWRRDYTLSLALSRFTEQTGLLT
jgi:hypothetical protein